MDKRILVFLLVSVLAACSTSPKPSMPRSTSSSQDGEKSLFSAGDNVTLSANDLDSRAPTSTPHTHSTDKTPPSKKQPAAGLPASSHGLTYWIERLNPNGGTQRVSASTLFHSADRIRIHVRSNRPGYLYVVNQGTSGKGSYLFPASASANEYVDPNQAYQIPVSGNIRFDNQPGQEIVWLFLSQRPLPVGNPSRGQIQPSSENFRQASYNPCGSKDLVVESPDTLQSSCGAGSKDLMLEDDSQGSEPETKVSLPTEITDKGQLLALRLVLRHD